MPSDAPMPTPMEEGGGGRRGFFWLGPPSVRGRFVGTVRVVYVCGISEDGGNGFHVAFQGA